MRNVVKAALVALILALAAPVAAQDFDAGREAYQRGDYAAALSEFRPLAEQGNAKAQNNLGIMYARGVGVPQDFAEALRWYRKAVAQGNASAQSNLGVMYAGGQGVAQDYAEALKWYSKAAEQGHAQAQYNLGVMYDNGQGVAQDKVQAHMWLNLADRQGFESAAIIRDRVAGMMTFKQFAEAQKLAREWKPK